MNNRVIKLGLVEKDLAVEGYKRACYEMEDNTDHLTQLLRLAYIGGLRDAISDYSDDELEWVESPNGQRIHEVKKQLESLSDTELEAFEDATGYRLFSDSF